jgi:hypothetical protein
MIKLKTSSVGGDHRTKVILALCVVVIVLLGFVTINAYGNKKSELINEGVQQGALLQQQEMLRSIQATGYYSMNLVDANGNPTNLILAPVRQ